MTTASIDGVVTVKIRYQWRVATATVLLLADIAQAHNRDAVTAQIYLAYNETQQLSFVSRMARSQQESINVCAADLSTAELREFFNGWIEENPGFLSRNVVLAFSAAILDRCREEELPKEKTRLDRIEEGEWTAVPYVLGLLNIDVFNDFTFQSEDPDDEINVLFAEPRLDIVTMFSRQLYLEAGIQVAPEGDPPPGNIAFENHGLRIDALALTWDRERFWISGGKGRANHGIAAGLAPGIWGVDVLLAAFSVQERLGLAGNMDLGGERSGHHALYAGVFMADTTFLSRPYFSDGETVQRSDGGPSNTGGLNSYVVSVDGSDLPRMGDFRYHVSVMKQAVDHINDLDGEPLPADEVDDEFRIVAAIEWSGIDFGKKAAITPLVEYGELSNARGLKDREERFLTASVLLTVGRWNAALASTAWKIDQPGGEKLDYSQFQVSGGYAFENGIRLDAGLRLLDEFGIRSRTFGLACLYALPFSR